MVLLIDNLRSYDDGIEGNKYFVLEYCLNENIDVDTKEFKDIIRNRNKAYFKNVIEKFRNQEGVEIIKKEDKQTWLRLGAGLLHTFHFQGGEYIAVPRYDAYHPSNPTKLSLCSGGIESFEELCNPRIRAEIEGYEELLFVVNKDKKRTLLLPESKIGRESALAAAKAIGLEARTVEVPQRWSPQQKETLIVTKERSNVYTDCLVTFNFTNNSFNFIQTKNWHQKDIEEKVGEFTLGMLELYTYEEANGKRILRYAHLIKIKDLLETKNGFVNAYNYDGNGSASPGSTFYNPTLSLRCVIAKLHKNENWVDLLSVD